MKRQMMTALAGILMSSMAMADFDPMMGLRFDEKTKRVFKVNAQDGNTDPAPPPPNSPPGGQPQPPPPPAVGTAMAKARVMRNRIVQEGEDYRWISEQVCTMEFSTPIYDLRNVLEYSIPNAQATCDTQFNGKPAKFMVGLSVLYVKGDFFLPEPGDMKALLTYAYGWVLDNSVEVPRLGTSVSGSRDLTAKNFVNYISTNQMVLCMDEGGSETSPVPQEPSIHRSSFRKGEKRNCTVTNPEAFTVSLEVQE